VYHRRSQGLGGVRSEEYVVVTSLVGSHALDTRNNVLCRFRKTQELMFICFDGRTLDDMFMVTLFHQDISTEMVGGKRRSRNKNGYL
jgi:hypothetical protein